MNRSARGDEAVPEAPEGTARRLRRLPRARAAGRRVPVARGLRSRLLGLALLDRGAAGPGLLIPRCSSVHTVGMRFPLDITFLGSGGEVLARWPAVPPGRVASHRGACAVLEIPSLPEAGSPTIPAAGPRRMSANEVKVPTLSPERLRGVLDDGAWDRFQVGLERARQLLEGRRIWNVNSTASGGGVAEMLWSWVGMAHGLGVDMRWLTIDGSPEFFALTKRLHNMLHGDVGDGGELGERERRIYERVSAENAAAVAERLAPGDVVFLHDPQTAGQIPELTDREVTLVWRCHVGADVPNRRSELGWKFLQPYLPRADALVFSRAAYVPDYCAGLQVGIVPPSIDAFSPKNQDMEPERARAVLRTAGLLTDGGKDDDGEPTFARHDGRAGRVERRCELLSETGPPPAGVPLVTQVSRWDRLKDPVGVMRGFARVAERHPDTWLILAGPAVGSVSDDPEGAEVLTEVEADWRALPAEVRGRVVLASLPMDDLEENAAIVNALQRRATVVVQKSLKEGFGLTVTEAMWKGRPVLASATGGIGDQIEDGVDGLLLGDPLDLDAFAAELDRLLSAPERARAIGDAAREKVRRDFLEDRHSLQYVELLERLLA